MDLITCKPVSGTIQVEYGGDIDGGTEITINADSEAEYTYATEENLKENRKGEKLGKFAVRRCN